MGRYKGQEDYFGYGRKYLVARAFGGPHVELLLHAVKVQVVLHILCSLRQGLYYR